MSRLAQIIQGRGLSGTAAEIRSAMDAVIELSRDNTRHAIDYVRDQIGDLQKLDLVLRTIRTVADSGQAGSGLAGAADKLLGGIGVDFGSDATQAQLDTLAVAGRWPDELRDRLKAIGVQRGKIWEAEGLPELPAVEDIEAALTEMDAAEKWAHIRDDVVPPLLTSGVSWETILLAIGEV